jgi:GT2 family glycosyltransferase
MSLDVSVVVVSYNSGRHLRPLFESLRAHTCGVTYEVILVDNASTDGTPDTVAATFPWVRLVRRRRNGGLSRAINDGVAASSGRHVAVLNPDVRFAQDALTLLTEHLCGNAQTGVVAPKLLDDDGTLQWSCRTFPGYATALFSRYSLLTRLLPGNAYSRRYLMSDFDHATPREVDWVSGAALMFPRAVFEEVGGWDAGFFMFNEDVDFCRRVHDAGYRVVYEPRAWLYHTIGVSRSTSPRLVLARHRSMWRYYQKHLRGNALQDGVTAAGIAARCVSVLAAQAAAGLYARMRARLQDNARG